MIRNIFDEMYFGTKDVWGGHLTSTSWNNMSGLAKTINSVKYAVPDTICLGFSNHMLSDDENLQVVWEIDKKRILFIYSVSLPNLNSVLRLATSLDNPVVVDCDNSMAPIRFNLCSFHSLA